MMRTRKNIDTLTHNHIDTTERGIISIDTEIYWTLDTGKRQCRPNRFRSIYPTVDSNTWSKYTIRKRGLGRKIWIMNIYPICYGMRWHGVSPLNTLRWHGKYSIDIWVRMKILSQVIWKRFPHNYGILRKCGRQPSIEWCYERYLFIVIMEVYQCWTIHPWARNGIMGYGGSPQGKEFPSIFLGV